MIISLVNGADDEHSVDVGPRHPVEVGEYWEYPDWSSQKAVTRVPARYATHEALSRNHACT